MLVLDPNRLGASKRTGANMRLGHLCQRRFGTGTERVNVPTPHQLTRRMAGRISRFELARQAPPRPSVQCASASGALDC
jgi:hypothetical protein